MMRTHALCYLSLLCVLPLGRAANGAVVDHSAFDKILRESVNDQGLVNYRHVRDNSLFDLHVYLDSLAHVNDMHAMQNSEQLAYYINLYNASVILAIVERYHDGYTPAKDEFALFSEARVNIPGGRKVSLNELEHVIIRPRFKDPRVHAALVCGARSCPPLLPRAYVGEGLDKTLDQNMRRFINDNTRNTIDRENRKLVLSKIFEWYSEDFGGKDKLATYVSRFVEGGSVEGFSISFHEYDWSLNGQ
jgi:hypothetical protein